MRASGNGAGALGIGNCPSMINSSGRPLFYFIFFISFWKWNCKKEQVHMFFLWSHGFSQGSSDVSNMTMINEIFCISFAGMHLRGIIKTNQELLTYTATSYCRIPLHMKDHFTKNSQELSGKLKPFPGEVHELMLWQGWSRRNLSTEPWSLCLDTFGMNSWLHPKPSHIRPEIITWPY